MCASTSQNPHSNDENVRMPRILLCVMLGAVGCISSDDGASSDGSPAGPSQSGAASTRYVAPGGRDSGNTCLDAANPCLTPQHAHDVSQSGNTVEVRAGRYDGALAIAKAVDFKGESRGTTILAGGMTVRLDPGKDLKIEGFSVIPGASGATTGIVLEQLRQNSLVHLANVSIAGFSNRGLDVVISHGRLLVESTSITGLLGSDDGMNIRGSTAGMSPSLVNLNRLTVSDHGADGVQFSAVENIQIVVDKSLFERNGEAGIQVETMNSGKLDVTSSCVLTNGLRSQQAGISLSGLRGLTGSSITVKDNNIVGNRAGGAEIDQASARLNMVNNWWGRVSGPSVATGPGTGTGDSVSPGITFSPFAASVMPGTPCT
jgi:hypothetical protein